VYCDRSPEKWKWQDGLVEMATVELDGTSILAESRESWKGLPSKTIMGHIHLHVADLEEAKHFYTKGLGFDIVSYYPQAVFLSSGGYHHHIAINTWAGVGAPVPHENSVGLLWYTIIFSDELTRETAVEKLNQIGAEVKTTRTDYLTKDPSGNQIKLVL
jgi:catechol 2,3-dioxygenase